MGILVTFRVGPVGTSFLFAPSPSNWVMASCFNQDLFPTLWVQLISPEEDCVTASIRLGHVFYSRMMDSKNFKVFFSQIASVIETGNNILRKLVNTFFPQFFPLKLGGQLSCPSTTPLVNHNKYWEFDLDVDKKFFVVTLLAKQHMRTKWANLAYRIKSHTRLFYSASKEMNGKFWYH